MLVRTQTPNGFWSGGHGLEVNTAYTLLFLARGRHPVLMNKLRYEGDWANRPRDAANLGRFVGKQMEREFNWQVVNVATDWSHWLDSPILEISGDKSPKFSSEEVAKIRNYVEAGGMIYMQADGNSQEFNNFAPKFIAELFPKYPLTDMPETHPMFGPETVFKMTKHLPLRHVSNGARTLLVYSSLDLSRWWQQRDDKLHRAEFQFGTNMFVYAAGKRNFRNRLSSPYVGPVAAPAVETIRIGRVEYNGAWDPEPGAWKRYVNWFQSQTNVRLDAPTIKLDALATVKPSDMLMVQMTGTAKQAFTPAEVEAAKAYVESGGVLFIDVTGGLGPFAQSAQAFITQAFPGSLLQTVTTEHPILASRGPGTEDLTNRRLRADALSKVGGRAGGLHILAAGKGHVLFSDIDVTSGLLASGTGGIIGYDPVYAQSLMKNILLWAQDGQKDSPVSPAATASPAP